MNVALDNPIPRLMLGVVEVHGAQIGPASDELRAHIDQVVSCARVDGLGGGEARRGAVRDLLRSGGFKPSGRSKPAQEYLLRSIQDDGQLASIVNAVDLINCASIESGLPISLLALDRMEGELSVRYGHKGESYIFNRSGQELDVTGLICVCSNRGDQSIPVGSPVKDSMFGKVTEDDHHLVALIYAPRGGIDEAELDKHSAALADGFRRWCGASEAVNFTT